LWGVAVGRIFVVDEVNLAICRAVGLYGVPDSPRAARELAVVQNGERVFFYTTDTKRIYGVYRTKSTAFTEEHPEQGPWVGRPKDKRMRFYPFRVAIEAVEAYERPLGTMQLRRFRRGSSNQRIRRGSSVMYLDDKDTEQLTALLAKLNR
jgi:hypothetical protein